jgi:peptide subunit release factor 1 (eRF1)
MTRAITTSAALQSRLERLAAFDPGPAPVVSLYLDLTADQRGRDHYAEFLRKVSAERIGAVPVHSSERPSLEEDFARIESFLASERAASANGLAIFACAARDGFFEAIQLEAPLGGHWLFIGALPHLYPLARLLDQYPRYAAVFLDTRHARIFVFGLNTTERTAEVTGEKTKRTSVGGWSQARYQRQVENVHLLYMKEVVEALERIVVEDDIPQIVVIGDEVAVPLLRDQLPSRLAARIVDAIHLERTSSDADILRATLEVLRTEDARSDADYVEQLLGAWRSGGLGVAGPEATLRALQLGQVDELALTTKPQELKLVQGFPDTAPRPLDILTSEPQGPPDQARVALADTLVTRAQQTGASIRFIEDAALLRDVGGVGALLRFRI